MSTKLSLGDRMKRYEAASRLALPIRMPIIVRVDGKAFHTLMAKCEKPFDGWVENAMDEAARALCKEAQGAQLAYVQSDEVSVLIHGYRSHDSQAWFDGDLLKIVSVSAAAATAAFSGAFNRRGLFDSRAFVLPESDVCNYFLWRQQDATRNSINSMAQSMFSPRELHGKNTSECQEMMFQKGVNWNDLPTDRKRGRCAVRRVHDFEGVQRSEWIIDQEIPVFSQDRSYIEKYLEAPV
jgi:tRNA(His) 5'-end guanylyltransferase